MKPHELVAEREPDALIMEEFEDACIGMCESFGRPPVALYDYNRILDILVSQGMPYEEAVDHFSFNIGGAWVGDYTPSFALLFEPSE